MMNSRKYKLKVLKCKFSCIVSVFLILYILYKYLISKFIPYIDKNIILGIFIVFVILIVIIAINYILNLNKVSNEELKRIYYELDNSVDKIYDKYGLYITENYIVCIGNKLNLFKLFSVPIKQIDAIDINNDSRYFYKNKNTKRSFLSFISGSIKDDIVNKDNDRKVFNIIANKKVYCVTTSSNLNKRKRKEIKEMANYICNKYSHIDYI